MIKKISILALSLAMAAACTEVDELTINETGNETGNRISFRTRHETATESDARVALGDDGRMLVWKTGDAISVFDAGGINNLFSLTDGADMPNGVFSGSAGNAPHYALYPYRAEAAINGTNITSVFPQTQVLKENTLDPKAMLMVAKSIDEELLNFRNAFAILKFSLTGSAGLNGISVRSLGTEKLSGTATMDATSSAPSLDFASSADGYLLADAVTPVSLGSTAKVFYVVVPAQNYADGLEINFKTDRGVHIRHTSVPLTITRNQLVGTGTTDVIPLAYDLSTAGGDKPRETANCYVVEPLMITLYGDLFRFPADVMGNGIWGGFPDSDGESFTLTNVGATDAELLWQETANTLKDIALKNDYIEFKTNNITGNASIAATAGGDIKWSWHIWLPKTPIGSHVYDGTANTILQDRNLGALSAEPPANPAGSTDSYGLYYQFGRKDPFPRMENTAGNLNYSLGQTYDAAGNLITGLNINQIAALADPNCNKMATTNPREWSKFGPAADNSLVTATIGDAIKYPMWFFAASAPKSGVLTQYNRGNWYKAGVPASVSNNLYAVRNNSLWDARSAPADNDNVKSAFDPCPSGWKVPSRNALAGSNVELANALEYNATATDFGLRTRNGFSFVVNSSGDTAWYPATGFIQYSVSGSAPSYVYSYRAIYMVTGYQFTASNANTAGAFIRFNAADFASDPFINNSASSGTTVALRAAYGLGVRCMKDN